VQKSIVRPSVSFVIIATGPKYVDMALNLCTSIHDYFADTFELVIFTDDLVKFSSFPLNSRIKLVKTESLRWPEATLLRFHLISTNENQLLGDHILYIDADAILRKRLTTLDLFSPGVDMSFVQHPGTYRRGPFRYIYKRLIKPSWEDNKSSKSYVPWFRRRHYVCGGVWGGKREQVLRMCFTLRKSIDSDLEIGFYPKSYDESYLNSWASQNRKWQLLSPKFAYAEEFPWLVSLLDPFIVVLNKPSDMVEEKNSLEKNENRFK